MLLHWSDKITLMHHTVFLLFLLFFWNTHSENYKKIKVYSVQNICLSVRRYEVGGADTSRLNPSSSLLEKGHTTSNEPDIKFLCQIGLLMSAVESVGSPGSPDTRNSHGQ